MSDYCDNRTQGEAPQRAHGCRLGDASRHARWQTILAAVKANRMDSVMVRKCIAVALLMPEMSGESVVSHVLKNTQAASSPLEREDTNVVQLFAKAS